MFTIEEIFEIALFFIGSIGFFLALHAVLGQRRWGIPALIGSLCALAVLFYLKF
jgi:hypothetical protein